MAENEIDLNQDGKVSRQEETVYEQKAVNRRLMAWVALIALVVSGFSMMFLVPETRLKTLDGLLEIYWIALGSIVGAYVGISTWMSKK
jgi:Co/Zn/Cd efflux system component